MQFLQSGLGMLAFGQVTDEPGEEAPFGHRHFADRELHRKSRAVLALADDDPADADNSPFAGAIIALQITVMRRAIGLGHQHADILPNHLLGGPAEQALRGVAEIAHQPAFIDDNHRVGNRLEDRAQMCLAPRQILVHFGSAIASALEPFAADRHRAADDQKQGRANDVAGGDPAVEELDRQASSRAEGRSEQSRPEPRQRRRQDDRGHEKEEGSVMLEQWIEPHARGDPGSDRHDRQRASDGRTHPRERLCEIGSGGGAAIHSRRLRQKAAKTRPPHNSLG